MVDKKERQLTTIYSRVVGWLSPVSSFNKGKASEYKDRKVYKVDNE
jgi:anaerobic ribonucleoside-triphosphate reductase